MLCSIIITSQIKGTLLGSLVDSSVDILQTHLYFTPNAKTVIRNMSMSSVPVSSNMKKGDDLYDFKISI